MSYRISLLSIIIAFVSLLLSPENAFSQDLFFSTLSVKDGLPSNIISGISQDKNDFIWIGTGNGLTRYDGNHFKTFQKSESDKSLPSNEISCLLADGDDLWVGTWNGLCKINTITYEISRIDLGKNKTVRILYKDSQNILWVGTESGLIQYQDGKITNLFNTEKNGLSHNTIRSIYRDDSGTLWVGTYDKLNKLPDGSHQFEVFDLKGSYKPSLKNNLICGEIRPFSKNNDSLLWIGTETGLCLFNTVDNTYRHFGENNAGFSNEVIKCIYPDDEGNLWLGTDFGLNVFDPQKQTNSPHFHNPQIPYSIANNAIWQIFEDTGGVIWFVTSNGLSRLNKHRNFYEYHEVSNQLQNQVVGNQVKSVLITKKNIVWLATLHGVIRIDPKTNDKQLFDTSSPGSRKILLNNAYALEEDDYGRIWIGTAGGINVWDEPAEKMYSITADTANGLVTNYIARFVKGTDGSFWVSAYQGGLLKVLGDFKNIHSLRFKSVATEFGSEKVVAGAGAIWYSMYNELFRIDEETLTESRIHHFNELTNKSDIHCLYFSKKGTLWAGTQNGLIEYDPKVNTAVFRPIITGNDVHIGNLAEDYEGNILGATNYFIFKFNITTRETEIFPLDRNLPLKSFFYGCSSEGPEGEIIFGGDNGYISFQSEELKPNHYQPKIYITALEINNKPVTNDDEIDGKVLLDNDISFTQELTLDYAHRSITFEFSSLHYWQPAINVYAYKLEGFDDTWKYVSGQKNFAVYSNLSPQTYTFRVKGTNNYGVWSGHEATATIRVKPPLFLSRGFMVLYGLFSIALVFLGLRTYSARLHLRNELKITRLEKEHTEELAQAKQQFFTNISHELRTPISLILPPIHQILKRGNLDKENLKLITLAEKNSHRLLRVINQILDFRKLEKNTLQVKVTSLELVNFCQDIHALFADKADRKRISFGFTSKANVLKIWADVEKIETVLFNLLSNAFKFTQKGGAISLSIDQLPGNTEYPEGIAEIKITDTGIGIGTDEKYKIFEPFYQTRESKKMEIGTGIGLALASEYIKLHYGEIKVDSIKGKGSCFTVWLPLGNAHFPVDYIQEDEEINLVATKETADDTVINPYRFGLESEKPLIMIIDDSYDIIDFVRISLSSKYHFVSAENGEEGLQKAVNFLPEIIITDIMMPVMDGLTLCKKIKENPRTSHISIILLTAKDLTAQKIEGIRKGADVYITKPFEIEFLEANIDHLLIRKKELSDYLKNELIMQPSAESDKENVDDKFIKKVINIIETNISNSDFSVEILSDEIGMSSTHLYRKLKSLTRLSANEIIKKYRLKKASLLLRNKEGNISEIMYDVGFSNLSYFSKCFKSEFGLTPKDYQQKTSKSSLDITEELKLKNMNDLTL